MAAAAIEAIARRVRPEGMDAETAAVHDFCIERHMNKRVSDATYARALALLGEQGVVDLMGINGYYTLLAMVMNGAQTALPPSSAAPLPDWRRLKPALPWPLLPASSRRRTGR